MAKTFFIGGIYGVGKSTLCLQISKTLGIPFYNASDLISIEVDEDYVESKHVKDKVINQKVLVEKVKKILKKDENIILAGHFCITNNNNEVERLPEFVFHEINISTILLLVEDADVIYNRLLQRDKKSYNKKVLEEFQNEEIIYSYKIANENNIKYILIDLSKYDNIQNVLDKMIEVIGGNV
ncbi:MAG: ATP-binding protein [Candidatus Izemoplasmatales bacterium]